ncbi:hypothetical protein LguiB_019857 [Lonicera macranthoides]
MGRAPCCDKANVKKGPWSPEEDATLKSYIEQHGTGGNWIALPQKIGLKRCGKSCRLRWLNYLRPNIKHGGFSEEEDNIICSLYISIGSRWSIIAAQLPGRTDNDIKNYWNTRLKKKLLGKQRKQQQAHRGGFGQKQSMKKGREKYSMFISDHNINNNNNQNSYWPEPPVVPTIPYLNEEQRCFNDHNSIRKLLIKLGGRFSADDQPTNGIMNLQQMTGVMNTSSAQSTYDKYPINLLSPAPPEALNITSSSLLNSTQYMIDGAGQSSNLAAEVFGEVVYNNPQRLDGLEFLYGNSTSTCEENVDWGDMSSLVYNYEGLQQGTTSPLGCGFEEQRYTKGH